MHRNIQYNTFCTEQRNWSKAMFLTLIQQDGSYIYVQILGVAVRETEKKDSFIFEQSRDVIYCYKSCFPKSSVSINQVIYLGR